MKNYNKHPLRIIRLIKNIDKGYMADCFRLKPTRLNAIEAEKYYLDDAKLKEGLTALNVTLDQYYFLNNLKMALDRTELEDEEKMQCMMITCVEVLLNPVYKDCFELLIQVCNQKNNLRKKSCNQSILKYIRFIRYLSISEFCTLFNLPNASINKMERNVSSIDNDNLLAGLERLNITYDNYLMLNRFQQLIQNTHIDDENKHLCMLYATSKLAGSNKVLTYVDTICEFDRDLKGKRQQFKI